MALITSTTNTTQATDDSYVYTESEWLASGIVTETTEADTTTTVLTLDVMANDSGGKAKTLYSIEASDEFTQALLSSDVGGAPEPLLDEQGNYTGIQVWIENGRIMVDVTDALAALGAGSLEEMSEGQVIDHTFTYTIRLGNGTLSDAIVHFSITGEGVSVNMPSVIGGDLGGSGNETDEPLVLTGQLTLTDEDSTDTALMTGSQAGQYGTFTLQGTGQWTFQAYSAHDALATGEPLSESFLVQASDGSSQQVTVTITGTNDAVLPLGGTSTGAIAEDGDGSVITRTGTVVFSDPDLSQVYEVGQVIMPDGAIGSFNVEVTQDGATRNFNWTYEVSQAAVEGLGLAQGEPLELQFTVPVQTSEAADSGGLFPITITLTGTNDGVSITGGDFTGEVLVRQTVDGVQTGTIHFTDADFKDVHTASFVSLVNQSVQPLGTFALTPLSEQPNTAAGSVDWTYTPDAQAIAELGLMAGDTRSETYRITLTNPHGDPVSQDVTITIAGTDHSLVLISGLDERNAILGALTEPAGPTDPDMVEGDLVFSDADVGQAYSVSSPVVGAHGTLSASIAQDSDDPAVRTLHWTYTADPVAINALAAGQTETEVLMLPVDNGLGAVSQIPVVITLTGTNDAATMTGETFHLLTEDSGDYTRSGQLTVQDDDSGEAGFTLQSQTGQFGSFSFDGETGAWSYLLANSSTVVQGLNSITTLYDSLTVASTDGTASQTITIGVRGVNEPVASSGSLYDATIGILGFTANPEVQSIGEEDSSTILRWYLSVNDRDDGAGGPLDSFQYNGTGEVRSFGTFTYDAATQDWFYTLHEGAQTLLTGQTGTDTFAATSKDGTDSITLTVLVAGADDAATITGDASSGVTEDGLLTTGGTVTVHDADLGQNTFQAVSDAALLGKFGTFTFNAATGVWGYTLDHLPADFGISSSDYDTLSVTSLDGSAVQSISVLVAGVNDTHTGTDEADVLVGTGDAEWFYGGAGNDVLYGEGSKDVVFGEAGDDVLIGGEGDDGLFGGDGNDILAGGLGFNSLAGGAGADTFYFRDMSLGLRPNGTRVNFITDFDVNEDVILLSTLPDSAFASLQGLSADEVVWSINTDGWLSIGDGAASLTVAALSSWDGFSAANLSIAPVDEFMQAGRTSSDDRGGMMA